MARMLTQHMGLYAIYTLTASLVSTRSTELCHAHANLTHLTDTLFPFPTIFRWIGTLRTHASAHTLYRTLYIMLAIPCTLPDPHYLLTRYLRTLTDTKPCTPTSTLC